MALVGIEAGLIALGVGATTAATVAAIAQFLIVTAASTLLAKRGLPGGPGISARTLTSRGTIDPQQIIYGEALVAGTLAYRNATGYRNSVLRAVHLIAGHEVESIRDVYLDARLIPEATINSGSAAGGDVNSGYYGPTSRGTTVQMYKHLGTSSQTVNTTLNAADPAWTSAHRLRGIAYCVTGFVLNDRTESVWEAGDPSNVKFLVRGKKIYDPRLDSTNGGSGSHRADTASTWAWSDNPALCVADFIRDAKFSVFADGITSDRIDWDAVITAADACDALVPIPPASSPQVTQKRFTCNGVIYSSETMEDSLAEMLSSMNGTLIFSGGTYIISAGVYAAPVDNLNEDDIVGPIGVSSALDSDRRINTVKVSYIDAAKAYQPTEILPITIAAYKDTRDNGQELVDTIELAMTDNNYMAQRIALKRLYESNQELTLSVPCNLRAARLVPGERVSLTILERGWSGKIFKVLSWEFFDRGGDAVGVNVDLREDDSSAYADPLATDYTTINAGGTILAGDPQPIASVGTIPPGIRYGEGSWDILLEKNRTTAGADDGEILVNIGDFLPPSGLIRSITAAGSVSTPYEGSGNPPDRTFYIVWGATATDIRFAASPSLSWGSASVNAAGIFAAVFDRYNDQWYAVDNSGEEVAFTPADTDYVVARGWKNSTSGGIETLQSVVPFVQELLDTGANLIRDPKFERQYADTGVTLGSKPNGARYWNGSTSTWTISATAGENGGVAALRPEAAGGTLITSYYIPATMGERFFVALRLWFETGYNGSLSVDMYMYNADRGFLATVTFNNITSPTTGTWLTAEYSAVINNTNCRYVRFGIDGSAGTVGDAVVQSYEASRMAFEATVGATLGSNVVTSGGTVVGDDAVVRWEFDPTNLVQWTTYEAAGWSPEDTTLSITGRCFRGSTQIASRVIDFTLTASGGNEGDINAAGGTSTGDANTVSITANDSPSVSGYVQHTATGVRGYWFAGANIPGYAGSSISK